MPPSRATIRRMRAAVDGDAQDQVVGADLTARNPAGTVSEKRQVIAVDCESPRGSARLSAGRRHLLSALTHHRARTPAQAEIGTKTNETAHLRPLLEPLDLTGAVVTLDAPHSVEANVTWLVETKNAHYIAVIKRNQPTAHWQLAALPWPARTSPSSTPLPLPDTVAGSPARSRPAASPTNSAGSSSPLPHGRTRRRPRPPGRRGPAPRERHDLRRGRLHPPHRHRTPRHGRLPQPRHRPVQNPSEPSHRWAGW